MTRLVLFDFDGTLLKGDSTKLIFRRLMPTTLVFFYKYYLKNFDSILRYVISGEASSLKEKRRKTLSIELQNSDAILFSNQELKELYNEKVYEELLIHQKKGLIVAVVSAGYKETIELLIPDNAKGTIIIANYLYIGSARDINYDEKVKAVYRVFKKPLRVHAAYGNSNGDLSMLATAEQSYWVDKRGRLERLFL